MTTTESTNNRQLLGNMNATRIVASSFGILAGLTGLIAGLFEVRQGNVVPNGYWISYDNKELLKMRTQNVILKLKPI